MDARIRAILEGSAEKPWARPTARGRYRKDQREERRRAWRIGRNARQNARDRWLRRGEITPGEALLVLAEIRVKRGAR